MLIQLLRQTRRPCLQTPRIKDRMQKRPPRWRHLHALLRRPPAILPITSIPFIIHSRSNPIPSSSPLALATRVKPPESRYCLLSLPSPLLPCLVHPLAVATTGPAPCAQGPSARQCSLAQLDLMTTLTVLVEASRLPTSHRSGQA
jgi:hypothetical protein